MRTRNPEIMTGQQIAQYEIMRRGIIERRFNDDILSEQFQLSPRLAAFAREYALNRNAEKAARLAGYSEKTAHHTAARMIRTTANAVKAIRCDLVNIGAEFRAGLSEYLANGLIQIFENRAKCPGAAILAARELHRLFLEPPPIETPEYSVYNENQNKVDESGIIEEIRKMGIYPPENLIY